MQYRVQIVLTEIYSTWVEADSEQAAEDMAAKQFSNGELALDYESSQMSIIDTDGDDDNGQV